MENLLKEPRPAVTSEDAAAILLSTFGVTGTVSELPSERDRNFLVDTGRGSLVLKVSHSAENPQVIEMENAAMRHIESVDPELPIPRIVPAKDSAAVSWVTATDGRRHLVRAITVIAGTHLQGGAMTPELADQIGSVCARTEVALRGFFHPAAGRTHDWDIRHCGQLSEYIDAVSDSARARLIVAVLERITPALATLDSLPAQVQHADVTLTNILAVNDELTGVIDFGDIHHTASVCDLAVTLTSVLRPVSNRSWSEIVVIAAAFLRGYQKIRAVEVAEAAVLGDLVLARLTTTVLISAWRGAAIAENAVYIEQHDNPSWELLERLMELTPTATQQLWSRLAGTSRVQTGLSADARLHGRRDAVLGGKLAPLSYRSPLQIVRGEGPWVFDAAGRRYLDGYNNVPVVGHSHPVVNQAINRQLGLLNVNSRYLHNNVVELAERLLATMPDGLDTCVFVNSGTEAVDLAWRMATVFTGNSGAAVVDWAYHGISHAVSDFSPNDWSAQMASPGNSPAHVATFAAPSGMSSRADGISRVDGAVAELNSRGHRPALVILDPLFTSAGIIDASSSFMSGMVDSSRSAGALFLADEVQSGFGRTGEQLWRFVSQGVVPDFVTLGKPMGNGHPIGAVVTRREIAERFLLRQEYFSTFAASPVSSAAALTVLDVLEAEQLPAQAMRVGEYLRERVRDLDLGVIRDVRGIGLIAGIELDLSRPETGSVVEDLKQRGVLVGATGRGGNVLKVRPPLVWTERHADLLVAALAPALASGAGSRTKDPRR